LNLRWKAFEGKLKRRVRAEVRASVALRKEYKHVRRGRRWWNFRVTPTTYRLVLWFMALKLFVPGTTPVQLVLAFIWLWSMASAFWRVTQLQSALYFASELNLFNHLPITDGEIFRCQWRKFLRAAIWPGVDFVVLYGVLAFRLGAGWQSPLIGLLFGCVQSVFNDGIAVTLFGLGFRRRLHVAALLLYATAIGLVFASHRLNGLIAGLSDLAYWIPPAGWIHYTLGVSADSGVGSNWVPCLIAGTVLACYPIALRRLRQGYALDETNFAQAFRVTATGEASALRLREYGELFEQSLPDATATVKARVFLDRLDWSKVGFVERLVAAVLTEREKTIAEFLTAADPGWTRAVRTLLLTGLVLLILARYFSALVAPGIGMIVFMVVFLLIDGGRHPWRGFRPAAIIGLPPPFHAYYPVSFTELHRTVMKFMLVRFVILLPFLAGAAFVFGLMLKLNTGAWVTYGIKLILLCLIAQSPLALMPFSASSNDSDRFRFAGPALMYGLLTVVCAVAFVFTENWPVVIGTGLAAALLCWFAPSLYGRQFNRNKFDLLPSTRNTT